MSAGWIVFWTVFGIVAIIALASSIRTVRPVARGLVERFGKYKRFANPGLILIMPFGRRTGNNYERCPQRQCRRSGIFQSED
jgi:regulator of protease activity HflC (stomatin/prohibitin superfamily)